LSERFKLPARLFITSADGTVRHELLRAVEGMRDRSDARCWLPGGSHTIGRELTIKITKPVDRDVLDSRVRTIELSPGEYYIQVIYSYWLVGHWLGAPSSGEPRQIDGTADEPRVKVGFSEAEMDEPMAISTPVKLVVTRGEASAQPIVSKTECPLRLELQSPTTRQTKLGLCVDVPFRVTNQSDGTVSVFNPLLDLRLFTERKALDLAVVASDGLHLGNYTDLHSLHASRTPRSSDWMRFIPGATVGSKFAILRPDDVPHLNFARRRIPPGKYALELRGHEALIAQPPAIVFESNDSAVISANSIFRDWVRAFPGPEICRSNRVEFEILPRTGD
jgi:hypothetical protein